MQHARFPWLIIGAGPSGLACAHALRDALIHYEQVEKADNLGGLWDIHRKDTPIYETTHFISSKTMSSFSDFPMPEDYPDYPAHHQILAYIRQYAIHHGLDQNIHYGLEVNDLQPDSNGKWIALFQDGTSKIYEGVIVANGRNWIPNWPVYPGHFLGEIIHSKDYNSPNWKVKRSLS